MNTQPATESEPFLSKVSEAKRAAKADKAKAGTRKRGAYFIGFAAVIIGILAIVLANTLTFTLEVPENGIIGVAVLSGTAAAPEAFISHIEEMEGVVAEFLEPEAIDFYTGGRQEVVLTLQRGRRVGEAVAPLYIITPLLYVQIEAGTPVSDTAPFDFVEMAYIINPNTALDVVIHEGLPYQDVWMVVIGEYIVRVSVNGVFFISRVSVADTTPPIVTLKNITIPMGQAVEPYDFIVDHFDFSPVLRSCAIYGRVPTIAAWFVNEPYVFTPGEQIVEIEFIDYFYNKAVYSAVLTVLPNTVPPRILGARDIFTQIGSPIIFRRGVEAADAFGRPLDFTVDSSYVNIHEVGIYTAVYHTVDAWGLQAEVTVYVHVLEVDPVRVRELANAVLDSILHYDMTQVQQAQAIFDWISVNVAYAADVSRSTVYEGAYQGLRNRRGDCFVFYSVSEILLTQARIPNMHIRRIEGTPTRHSWNLINPDGIGWFHFDTTPLTPIFGQRLNRFMFTSYQARHHTQLIQSYFGMRDYYTYDPDLYLEIVQWHP
ncbi:MAG: transglutaminase-like domain-containing protein [Defluviitaleaceae bacterium]|nr:transglutaminase-like domain-containing protein [Defluviitaleaceae bacterium]